MQATHHAITAHALIVLHKANGTHLLLELALRETLEEITASIAEDTGLDNQQPTDRCLYNLHT